MTPAKRTEQQAAPGGQGEQGTLWVMDKGSVRLASATGEPAPWGSVEL